MAVAESQRLAKFLANAGFCSRRKAESLILEGRVEVNGQRVSHPAPLVTSSDQVKVDGRLISSNSPKLWIYHKPAGAICSHHDPQGRPTIFDQLPPFKQHVTYIGRLDFNSEGLLLLTNAPMLATYFSHPRFGWERVYQVRIYGELPSAASLSGLARGCVIDGVQYGPVHVTVVSGGGRHHWLEVRLREGKNREIRKIMNSFGLQVSKLRRVQYGPFELPAHLHPNMLNEVPETLVNQYWLEAQSKL